MDRFYFAATVGSRFHPAVFRQLQPPGPPHPLSTNTNNHLSTPLRFRHDYQTTLVGTASSVMAVEAPNPLISTQKSSGSGLQVALHPLVLLTISDYITRHTLRQQKGPVVGALLGQQNGREITIEHAFECLLIENLNANNDLILQEEWFDERLQQSKRYHKSSSVWR